MMLDPIAFPVQLALTAASLMWWVEALVLRRERVLPFLSIAAAAQAGILAFTVLNGGVPWR